MNESHVTQNSLDNSKASMLRRYCYKILSCQRIEALAAMRVARLRFIPLHKPIVSVSPTVSSKVLPTEDIQGRTP